MAASFGRKTMLLPQVLWSVLKIFISEIDRKYAENMRYPRPRLGRPNSFSGRSLGKNFVAQTNVWSHLATMRPAVSSTAFGLLVGYKKWFLQKLHRWIWAFCSHIDLCIVHLHFLSGMNLQFSTIAVRMHFFMFYMRICAYFGVRFVSIGVKFILGTKRTLKRKLHIYSSRWAMNYLNILCVRITYKVHKSRKLGNNCTQVTCQVVLRMKAMKNYGLMTFRSSAVRRKRHFV